MESSGQSRSSIMDVLRASQTSAQMPVIAAARVGEEDSVEPAPPEAEMEEEEQRPLLGTLRGGILALARSAAFLARCVA